ncbi:UGSC family (seleno)protein [Microbacterium karelineae]|uniref:UGSC family (seleno)protein n=1 Tax=Microbacterium karelineae TaxID=2654283 RepID=UPI0012EA2413|nr:UGSC family (seleno)protein [Microbacterium karelineae]
MVNPILDPTGGSVEKATGGLAARRPLAGARVGLLDNTKHNAMAFLQEVGRLLVDEVGAQGVSIVETKASFSVPVDEEIVDRYRGAADVVITGIGDCGSCSAAAVADGIQFEKAGIPAAVVLTDAFTTTGRTMAGVHGNPTYEWITTAHPVAVLEEDEVRARARTLLPEIVRTLEGATA